MSKEKQIEEMAKDLQKSEHWYFNDHSVDFELDRKKTAENLYNAGYRKQSEGEWKQTTEPLGAHDVDCVECSVCGESWVLDEDFDFDIVNDFWHYCPTCGAKMKGGGE